MTFGLIFSFIIIIAVLSIVIWLLLVYPKRYKANINKALNSGVPVKTIEPTILFGGIILLTLIILNIVLLVSGNKMQDDINQLQNNLSDLSSKLVHVQSQVSSTNHLVNEMYEDSKWIKSGEYTIESMSSESTADIIVVFEMNRVPSNGIITLLYKDENNVVLTQDITSDTTIFTTTITVDVDMEYDLSVMIDDGFTIENENLFNVDIQSDLRHYRGVDILVDDEDSRFFMFVVKNDYRLYPDLAFEEVVVTIYLNDIVVYTESITEASSSSEYSQVFEIETSPYSYGEGEVLVSILCIDKLGNEYEMFGEEWTVGSEDVVFPEQ